MKNIAKRRISALFTDKAGEISRNRIVITLNPTISLPLIALMSAIPASALITLPAGFLAGALLVKLSTKTISANHDTLKKWRLGTDEALQINNKR